MIAKNVSGQGIYFFASNKTTGDGLAGDQANITGVISKDGGAEAGFATATATNIGGGKYWQPLSQAESNCNAFAMSWTSTTTDILIEPRDGYTERGSIQAIEADTNELQAEWADGGRLDLILDARASSTEVTALLTNTRVVRVVPYVIERPDTGTDTYRIELYLYDEEGNMEAPDSAPTIALVNSAGTSRTSRLDGTTMALVSTGRYRAIYTAAPADTLEQLVWTFTVVEAGATRVYGNNSIIVDTSAVDFTSTDRTKLDSIVSSLVALDTLPADVWATEEGVRVDLIASAFDGMISAGKFSTAALSEVWSTIGAEPTAIPAAAVTMLAKIGLLYTLARNKLITDADGITLRNDADTADIGSASHEELAGTYTRNKFS